MTNSIDDTLAHCDAIIRERRAARHPFIATLREQHPDRRALGRWAAQKCHQVFLQNTIFSGIHAGAMHHEDVRQAMMEQLVAEETSIACGSAPHYVLMRRFATACGVSPVELELEACSADVLEFVDTVRSFCCSDHFVMGLLAVYAVESQSGEGVQKILDWLRAEHDFSEDELEWFVVHSEAEDEHAAAGLALIKKYAPLVDGFDERAKDTVETMCAAWQTLHDAYYRLLTGSESVPDRAKTAGGRR
jgi:pyrroloquinoline-quinone synthase